MKAVILFLTIMLLSSISFAGFSPECKYIGTRSEGWYNGDELIKYDFCEYKIVECLYNHTRSEGWYAYKIVGDKKLINYSFCSNESIKPSCRFSGTRSEGWYIEDEHLLFDHCSNQQIDCFYPGSRSEGWYAFEKTEPELIAYDVECEAI